MPEQRISNYSTNNPTVQNQIWHRQVPQNLLLGNLNIKKVKQTSSIFQSKQKKDIPLNNIPYILH